MIGLTPEDGVIDPYHRVYGYPGLHIVDGSTITANLGVNPSLTITAQAERAMSLWPNKGEADPRPEQGREYVRVAAVRRRTRWCPSTPPAPCASQSISASQQSARSSSPARRPARRSLRSVCGRSLPSAGARCARGTVAPPDAPEWAHTRPPVTGPSLQGRGGALRTGRLALPGAVVRAVLWRGTLTWRSAP